ncbi:MAG: acyltransferase family protein [Erysipelotrichaceae bacterium]
MIWIKYASIYVLLILLASIITGISSAKLQDEYFGRTNAKVMKGVAILAVMLCHLMGMFGGGTALFTPLGGIGVSIFLMLSAYGLNESFIGGGYKFWWRKRIIAVFIPYFLTQSILYWPFRDFNLVDFVLDITLINPKYCYGWYLNYILICYIAFYIVIRTPFLREHRIAIFTVISAVSFLVLREIKAEQALSFMMGIVLSEYKDCDLIRRDSNWKTGILLLIMGIVALAIKQTDFIRNALQIIYNLVQLLIKLPCGLGLCLIAISVAEKLNLRIFAIIGAISYELYLVHGYVLQWVNVSLTGEIIFIIGSLTGVAILHYAMKAIKFRLLSVK